MDDRELTARPPDEGDFYAAFGERLRAVLDIDSWAPGYDLAQIYDDVARQVEAAVRHESSVRARLRDLVFPELKHAADAPPNAGAYRAPLEKVKQIHQGLLFTGEVEGCDSTQHTLETLPVSVTQIGVSLVSYNGNQGTWMHRLFRRDLNEALEDPAQQALALLERRSARDGEGHDDLSRLARRAIARYAERAILLHRSDAMWRLCQGRPAPFELLSGAAGSLDIMIEATRVLEELICRQRKFVFVSREAPDWLLRTLGAALQPLEYAIVRTLKDEISRIIDPVDYSRLPSSSDTTVAGRRLTPREWLPGLAPGQAIVAFPHLARPLLVAMDPAPSQLRLVD